MPFNPQNFVNNQLPAVSANWLNGVDVTVNSVLGGAQTVSQAQTALAIPALPVSVANGGTGATTASAALTALGGTTLAAVETAFNPQTAAEIAVGVMPVSFLYPQGNAFRYGFVGNGVTDDTTALQNLFTVCQTGVTGIIPYVNNGGLGYKISAPLTFEGGGGIYMDGVGRSGAWINASLLTSGQWALTVFGVVTEFTIAVQGAASLSAATAGVNGIRFGISASSGNLQRSFIRYAQAWHFNGSGIAFNDCLDSQIEQCTALQCGNSTSWSFSVNNVTDTTNNSVFGHIQSEQATNKAVFIDQVIDCCFTTIHSEQAVGDGTNPTHVFGGGNTQYSNFYIPTTSNGLIYLNGSQCIYGPANTGTANLQFANGNPGGYAGSNQVNFWGGVNVTELASNIYGWDFRGLTCPGTLKYQSGLGLGYLRFRDSSIANVAPTGNGSTATFIDCKITGSWTDTGNAVVYVSGSVQGAALLTNFPTTSAAYLDNVSVTNAFTTAFNQQIVATRCTFSGQVTIGNNGANWKSDACTFAADIVLGSGTPGFTFGPRDRVTSGTVSAGLLGPPTSSNVTYVQGDKTWNLQPSSTSAPAWACTTAGTPGTWTAFPVL